jgi:hypothetical protein
MKSPLLCWSEAGGLTNVKPNTTTNQAVRERISLRIRTLLGGVRTGV